MSVQAADYVDLDAPWHPPGPFGERMTGWLERGYPPQIAADWARLGIDADEWHELLRKGVDPVTAFRILW